jgi:hypothetical protein
VKSSQKSCTVQDWAKSLIYCCLNWKKLDNGKTSITFSEVFENDPASQADTVCSGGGTSSKNPGQQFPGWPNAETST